MDPPIWLQVLDKIVSYGLTLYSIHIGLKALGDDDDDKEDGAH